MFWRGRGFSSLRLARITSCALSCLIFVTGCRATGSNSSLAADSRILFANPSSYSDLTKDLPLEPWLNAPNSSERYFPIFIGATAREISLGMEKPRNPRLPEALRLKAESRVGLLRKMTGVDSFEVQAWPSLDENGQLDWVFARWLGADGVWRWLTTADAKRFRGKHDHSRPKATTNDDPLFPYFLQPSHEQDEKEIFADFMELPGLYDQPLYGNCVFVDRKTQKIVKAWPNPYSPERARLREEFTRRGGYNAYCVNPPAFFNDQYVVMNLKISRGAINWPVGLVWQSSPYAVPSPIDKRNQVVAWPQSFVHDYVRDIKIADGELAPKLPDGRVIRPFKKKGSFQVGHDLERMVDYFETRYKELGIAFTRQRFKWRDLPQSNLIAVIPGLDNSLPPVVVADHIDSAVAEDIFDKTGERVTTAGANDNSTATSTLLQAAKILGAAKPKRPIWLVHLTGEEFPSVDLGARHFLTEVMQAKQDIHAVIITDFIGSHQPDSRRFQISPSAVKGSERFAAIALDASKDLASGDIEAMYQPRDQLRNSVFQTDLLEFEFRGYPGILFNEDMDYSHPETNNPNYHQSTDVVANIDVEFSAKIAKIAIETALRVAND